MLDAFQLRRLPLHVYIATLFIALILFVGIGLSYYSYIQTKKIVLDTADQFFDRVVNETVLNFQHRFSPIQQAIKLVTLSSVSTAENLSARMDHLPLFIAAIEDQPNLTALYAGYLDGDFFIVRQILTAQQLQHYAAPERTRYVVDHIETASGRPEMIRIFINNKGQTLTERDLGETDFDPRTRPWYGKALANKGVVSTSPYYFHFAEIAGITIAQENKASHTVIAADITLEQMSVSISQQHLTESSVSLLYTEDSKVLAYHDLDVLIQSADHLYVDVASIDELNNPLLTELNPRLGIDKARFTYRFNNEKWHVKTAPLRLNNQVTIYFALMAPEKEIIADAIRIQRETLLFTLVIIFFSVPVAWWIADRISAPLRHLAKEAKAIELFDFDSPIKTKTMIVETAKLAESMQTMKTTIHRFLTLIKSLSAEQNFDKLLKRITEETLEVSQASAALVYLLNDEENQLQPGCLRTSEGDVSDRISMQGLPLNAEHPMYIYKQSDKTSEPQIFSLNRNLCENHPELLSVFDHLSCDFCTTVLFPLVNRNNEPIGILVLFYVVEKGHAETYRVDERYLNFTHALSSFTALSMESRQLIQSQKDLLASFIKLIAGAIDAKSPYTGGHCQRVPELTRMLTKAACDSNAPPFQDFQLEEDDWEELHIASWMHDCGKVTTPEYVVDKATKLETLYNRIHEIRMRFEVVKCGAEIDFWKQVSQGEDENQLRQELDKKLQALDEDFAFVAECNQGETAMTPEVLARLQSIAGNTWLRTLDDRLGLSWEELQRRADPSEPMLPVTENLLADKAGHIIERTSAEEFPPGNPWGFKLEVPEHKLNRGELHNLSVVSGTLTKEERYIINDHISQTIMMLEALPYPRHLRHVPAIAGGHHEKMDGTGYPRKLTGNDLPLTARVVAIADIFEALTASDRPYKKPKKIGEAIRIMSRMRDENHIDKDLFALFLNSYVYLDYAVKFLPAEQMEDVDISQYIS